MNDRLPARIKIAKSAILRAFQQLTEAEEDLLVQGPQNAPNETETLLNIAYIQLAEIRRINADLEAEVDALRQILKQNQSAS